MRGVAALCAQDFKQMLKNALFWVLTATLAVIVLVVNFALPAQLASDVSEIVIYNAPQYAYLGETMDSEEALREAVARGNVVGLLGDGESLTVIHPPMSEKTLNAIMGVISGGEPAAVTVKVLDDGARAIPFNQRMAPVFICFEALITGFILGGALMLAEKESGTVKALRISPMGTFRYVISKTLLFSVIGTLYAALICVFCVGFGVAWLPFLLLAFFGTATITLIGLAYTTLMRDMGGWFFSMTLLLAVNMLPVISYSSPSFAPGWMKLIPSYPVLFSFEKAMFGGQIDLAYVVLAMAAWLIIAYALAHMMTRKLFLKGAKGA